jgi:drug/metabolite transporter (DMT)-like permease
MRQRRADGRRDLDVADSAAQSGSVWLRAMPAVFVFFWSTGFVAAKYGMPYAPPGRFLAWRFALVIVLLGVIVAIMRAPWPATRAQALHLAVAGVLVQAAYLGGVFYAIDRGMSAGLAALLVGLQPVLTAIGAAVLLDERASARQWLGLALGLGGAALVLWNKISVTGLSGPAIAYAAIGLVGITAGTLYQKRYCGHFDLRTGALIQFVAALACVAPFALVETRPVEWTAELVGAMLWLVVVLSLFTIALLAILIRRGAATKVASLFYLVPPTTALMGFALFGEQLSGLAMLGMALAVVGVALVVRQ